MRPDYAMRDPRGWCGDPKRGAAFGRGGPVHEEPKDAPVKLYLSRVAIDSGGYDPCGTYWGFTTWHERERRAPGTGVLYWYANAEQTVEGHLRAWSREEAKAQILESYPKARFFR